jgi:hypothetical protein
MTSNLNITSLSVGQTDKETTINDAVGALDAAVTASLTFTWTGSEGLKTASTAQTQQNAIFVLAGSTSGTPSFKFGNVQRGVVVVRNTQSVDIVVSDYSSATTITVAAGETAAMYVSATGIFALVSASVSSGVSASTTEALTGTSVIKFVTPDALAALWEKGSDIASSGTISVGEGGYFHITGTTTITDIDWSTAKNGRPAIFVFDGILTLTHNGTTLVLPGGANITTAAGDTAIFVQDASDNVKCVMYQRADGTPIAGGSFTAASTTEVLTGTDAAKGVTSDALAAVWEQGSAIASAATISIGEGGHFHVTGTATITDIDFATDKAGRKVTLTFDGILTLTHNGTTLILPTGANITTAAGDTCTVVSEGSDAVRIVSYMRADGTALVSGGGTASSTTQILTGTDTTTRATPDAIAALWEKGSDVASAGTVSFGEGGYFHVTGTATITDIDFSTAKDGRFAWVIFDGALTLTHNGTTLILPGGANIATAAGDRACFIQDNGDNVYCVAYIRANGKPVVQTSQVIAIAVSDETTALTTGTAKVTFRMPFAFTLTDVRASVTTAPTGGTLLTVDVNEAGSTILSTKLTFDASEKTTVTAATPRVISDSSIADDAEITIDIDAIGSTVAGAGLKVYLIGYPT